MLPQISTRKRLQLSNGATVAKWTRSRGFEMSHGLEHAESVNHLLAIVGDSLDDPTFRLQQLEYRDKQVFLIREYRLAQPSIWNVLQGPVQLWIESQIRSASRKGGVFHGMPRGRYWEVVVRGVAQLRADGVFIRSQPRSPFADLKLSHQLGLLLFIYGPMSPAQAARGLDVKEQRVKGAAAALARKELIVKGKEPYTPIELSEIGGWLIEEFGDRMPRWLETLLKDPTPVIQRANQLKAKTG